MRKMRKLNIPTIQLKKSEEKNEKIKLLSKAARLVQK